MSAFIEFPFPTLIKNLDTPVDDADCATKGYVDGHVTEAIDAANVVLSVNGILPVNNNVNISLVGTTTGPLDERPLRMANPEDGSVYIVSGDPDPTNDGLVYIFSSTTGVWIEISPPGLASSDARYVLKSGDAMTGDLQHTFTSGSTTFTSELNYGGLSHTISIGGVNRVATFNALGIDLDDGTTGNTDIRPGSIAIVTSSGAPAIPSLDSEVTTKKYVDDNNALKLSVIGGTMTGPLVLPGAPTLANQAATKAYVDNAFDVIFGELDHIGLCMAANKLLTNTTAANPLPVNFDSVTSIGGELVHSAANGSVTLKAGKLYHLRASLGGTGRAYYAWTAFQSGGILRGGSIGSMVGLDDGINTIADCIFKPTVDIAVIIRQWGSSGAVRVYAPNIDNYSSGWATIVQLR